MPCILFVDKNLDHKETRGRKSPGAGQSSMRCLRSREIMFWICRTI
jgi:hypothetical protein